MVKAVIMIVIVGYFIGCIHGSKVAQILSGVDLKKLVMAMLVPPMLHFLLAGNMVF